MKVVSCVGLSCLRRLLTDSMIDRGVLDCFFACLEALRCCFKALVVSVSAHGFDEMNMYCWYVVD